MHTIVRAGNLWLRMRLREWDYSSACNIAQKRFNSQDIPVSTSTVLERLYVLEFATVLSAIQHSSYLLQVPWIANVPTSRDPFANLTHDLPVLRETCQMLISFSTERHTSNSEVLIDALARTNLLPISFDKISKRQQSERRKELRVSRMARTNEATTQIISSGEVSLPSSSLE